MSDSNVSLTDVLERILRENHADDETEELSPKESKQVYRLVAGYIGNDNPWWNSLDPFQIADDICGGCEGMSLKAAERWLQSLSEGELADLQLGDVLAALQPPGHNEEYEQQAEENEGEHASNNRGE